MDGINLFQLKNSDNTEKVRIGGLCKSGYLCARGVIVKCPVGRYCYY